MKRKPVICAVTTEGDIIATIDHSSWACLRDRLRLVRVELRETGRKP